MSFIRSVALGLGALGLFTASLIVSLPSTAFAAGASDYRFELAEAPQKTAPGVNTVSVRLVHVPDGKPVSGAVIIQTRADMGPERMAAMTAPVKALPATTPGIYRFQIDFGPVWNKRGEWALTLAAKVQGETETVRGSVNLTLEP